MSSHQAFRTPAVVTLPAQIDLTNADRLYDRLYAAFASGVPVVIADFTATTFCDCSSLRRLVTVIHRAAAHDAQLRVVIPPGTPVRRIADLLDLDRQLAVYPSLSAAAACPPSGTAAWPGGVPGQDGPTEADIIDVIRADRVRIARCQDELREPSDRACDPGARQAQAAMWARLARLVELHLDAEEEICQQAIYRAGPGGAARFRAMLDEHEDIRERIREARLQPTGSRLWWQLIAAATAAWTWQLGGEEHDILGGLRQAEPMLRQRLGRQWQAYLAARIRDQDQQEPAQIPGLDSRPAQARGLTRPRLQRMPATRPDPSLHLPARSA